MGLSTGVSVALIRLEERSRQIGEDSVALPQLSHLTDLVSEWLATSDLVLGSGHDLLTEHAERQAASADRLVSALVGMSLSEKQKAGLETLRDALRRAQESVAAASELFEERDRDAQLPLLLAAFDEETREVPSMLTHLRTQLEAAAQRDSAALRAQRLRIEAFAWAGGIAYLIAVGLVWRWVTLTVTVPLADLTRAAERSRSDGGRLDFEPHGPTEVRSLATAVASFARELEASNEVMERTIEQRTMELVQSNRVKSEFIANMSHEIRTPMNGVIGMAELLLVSELPPEQERKVSVLLKSANHLLALLNDILNFSRVEAEHVQLEPVTLDLHELVEEIEQLFAGKAASKRLALVLSIDPSVPRWVCTDGLRLRQVLANLVGNAVKFTESGEVAVRVCASQSPVGIRFEVSDTGIGIPESLRDRIFEPFTQADGSFARRFEGTGLGLTISRQLAELLGGSLTLAPAQGAGSTFWLELPLSPVEAVKRNDEPRYLCQRPLSPQYVEAPKIAPAGAAPRVLVAEDNHVNQLVAKSMLKHLGYQAVVVANGREAVEAVARERFALVLMDCQMPEFDGLAATRSIRESEAANPGQQAERLPIIALTAHAAPSDLDDSLAAGMDSYLSKPYTLEQLQAVLQRWIASS